MEKIIKPYAWVSAIFGVLAIVELNSVELGSSIYLFCIIWFLFPAFTLYYLYNNKK